MFSRRNCLLICALCWIITVVLHLPFILTNSAGTTVLGICGLRQDSTELKFFYAIIIMIALGSGAFGLFCGFKFVQKVTRQMFPYYISFIFLKN